ncbi:MAG: ATP-binding cassette domain-containing protein [Actinobacteria bacterium]|nr:ATP-binding cassette domain-containing protein [Actinomycetota bacterium]
MNAVTETLLVLADGTVFEGEAFGAETPGGVATGEVVFNTALTGYQEIITDPSYAGQMITFTYPHIGNYGVTHLDDEAARPHARGVIVRELARRHSNWRSETDLDAYLRSVGVPGIGGIDTRRLTRHIRDAGAMPGAFGTASTATLHEAARAEPGTSGADLARQVSCASPFEVACTGPDDRARRRVVAFDFGIKATILRHLSGPSSAPEPGSFSSLEGADQISRALVIDQTPLARMSRSNPLTLLGVFDELRKLFAALPASRARGFGPSRFSFNVRGGRCETCGGHGEITVQLQLLPEAVAPCPTCGGRRYNRETLGVSYRGHSIADVLDLSVDRALQLFRAIPALAAALEALQKVGLGYLPIGQPADRLSGGEAQRVRLATALASRTRGPSLYLLDEPTTGLHLAEVERLLSVFFALCESGHTLVVVEHHPDVIRHADHIIDLGPGGGEAGGRIVAEGTPPEVARCAQSATGQVLRK